MPRIAGVDIPANKKTFFALQYIYGVGPHHSRAVLVETGISADVRAKDLTEDEVSRLAAAIERNYVVEGNLRRQIQLNIARLKDIGCYRGLRHRRGLPARGQRTRTNARTRKGPRKGAIAKKKVE